MTNLLKRVPVPEQDAKIRATNFKEACLGYSENDAKQEEIWKWVRFLI